MAAITATASIPLDRHEVEVLLMALELLEQKTRKRIPSLAADQGWIGGLGLIAGKLHDAKGGLPDLSQEVG